MHTARSFSASSIARPIAALAMCLLAACGQTKRPIPPPPYVSTTVADSGMIHPARQLAGIIAPYENLAIQTTLVEPADAVNVQEGDVVSRGEVLAQLDTADLAAQLQADLATANSDRASTTHTVYAGSLAIAQGVDTVRTDEAAVRTANANLERDRRDLTRDRDLFGNGFVSEQQLQTQEATVRDDEENLHSAVSTLEAAKSNVQANGTLATQGLQSSSVAQSAATEQVALAQAQQVRVQIGKARIVSPIDGVVVNRNLNPGEYPGNRQIFTIQQVDPVYAILRGSSAQIAQIFTGAHVLVHTSDTETRGSLDGSVIGVLNQIAPGSTDFQVKVLLRNPSRSLRPGMVVSGLVTLPTISGVRVPLTAFTDDNHNAIDIVASGGTVKTLKVTEVGNDGKTSIVSGIAPGTRIISDGQSSVGDGEKVSIR